MSEATRKPTLAQQMAVAAAASPTAFYTIYFVSGIAAASTAIYAPIDPTLVGTTDRGAQLMIFITTFFAFVATGILLTSSLFSKTIYADPSCHDSRQSIWNTWCTIAKAWDLLPLPITDELVLAEGASLKHGGYRSSKNYFSRAIQEHRDQYVTPLKGVSLG